MVAELLLDDNKACPTRIHTDKVCVKSERLLPLLNPLAKMPAINSLRFAHFVPTLLPTPSPP